MAIEAIAFKENPNTIEHVNTSPNEIVKSDLVKSPDKDTVEISTNKNPQPKKKHTARNIFLGALSTIGLIYGGLVTKRKLSKPKFGEVQKCFNEIFGKDFSESEIKELLKKYKDLCKNDNTEDFAKQMVEQLKKDYGIEQVETKLTVTKLADNKLSTALAQTELGNVNPLGEINILPRTASDNLLRSDQGGVFSTGVHELKHLKQFADAYRANPERFAEALINSALKNPAQKEIIDSAKKRLYRRI
jgi:hypothetical protein